VANTWKAEHTINDLDTKLWVERYKSPGEFKFETVPTAQMRDRLEIGTFISHVNTNTVMVVEDHEITEEKGSQPKFTITGRSLDSFLYNRVATDDDMGFDPSLYDGTAWPYILDAGWPWEQAVDLMYEQLVNHPDRPNFEIEDVNVVDEINPATVELPAGTVSEEREIERTNLYEAIHDIMAEYDFGLRVDRPIHGTSTKLRFVIYQGVDRSKTIQFSYEGGDIETARYFWSDRKDKNAAYIHSKYYGNYRATAGPSGFNRRVMLMDMTSFQALAGHNGWTAGEINTKMNQRADRGIRKAKSDHLLEATLSEQAKWIYRVNYYLGDKVWLNGNFDFNSKMRVLEYTEIEDKEGEKSYPTLAAVRN
jgi:hypothetical protein